MIATHRARVVPLDNLGHSKPFFQDGRMDGEMKNSDRNDTEIAHSNGVQEDGTEIEI